MTECVLVADCGSTNIAVSAVDAEGNLLAAAERPNSPVPQDGGEEGWLVWDMEGLWEAVTGCCREVVGQVGAAGVRAFTATTWGADGAPVTDDGELTYPPIAWQCPRTRTVARRLAREVGPRRLFGITGYQVIAFNTLFKLRWLQQNAPDAIDRAEKWLMMPGLLSLRLTGELTLDVTSASTMMMLDLERRDWSPELLEAAGVEASFLPKLVQPGTVIGGLTAQAAEATGLPEGLPVVASGHDTQFAPIGSGARPQEAVLSTGTWEIAMLRTEAPVTGEFACREGILTELDAVPGLYDPQLLMMGSGVLEWVRECFYGDAGDGPDAYRTMIAEAQRVPPGAGGVMVNPSFVPETGPSARHGTAGTILGLELTTGRAQVYRAALEGLCFQLREALRILSQATQFEPERLRVVGGGSRNELWNQLRADVCRLPVVVTERKEATSVGAAVSAWVGIGRYASFEEGEAALPDDARVIEPSEQADRYDGLYARYRMIAPALDGFYTA
ncbi:MAG: FGGY family carbohydrate kinase [Candidatus Brocadiia bacterium]